MQSCFQKCLPNLFFCILFLFKKKNVLKKVSNLCVMMCHNQSCDVITQIFMYLKLHAQEVTYLCRKIKVCFSLKMQVNQCFFAKK